MQTVICSQFLEADEHFAVTVKSFGNLETLMWWQPSVIERERERERERTGVKTHTESEIMKAACVFQNKLCK